MYILYLYNRYLQLKTFLNFLSFLVIIRKRVESPLGLCLLEKTNFCMVELVFSNLFNINPATILRLDFPPQNHFMLYSYGEHNSDKSLLCIISCDYYLFSCVFFLHLKRATIPAIWDCGSFTFLVVYYEFLFKISSTSSTLNLLALAIVSIGTPSSCIPLIICIFPS